MQKTVLRGIFLVCLIGASFACLLSGCVLQEQQVLGIAPPPGQITPIHDLKVSSKRVLIAGTMVEKCPISGCWFKVADKTGVIKVDTKAAGFVVMNVPLHTQVTVSGVLHNGDERLIEAKGVRY